MNNKEVNLLNKDVFKAKTIEKLEKVIEMVRSDDPDYEKLKELEKLIKKFLFYFILFFFINNILKSQN